MTRSSPSSSTCASCLGINLEDLKSEEGYIHQPSCAALFSSAESCQLCGIIVTVLKRCIHLQRRQTSPYKNISDVGHLGPLRLFAADRDIGLQNIKRRKKGPVVEKLLSQNVTIVTGEVDSSLYYQPDSPMLDMYADLGSFAESAGVAVIQPIEDDPACDSNISRTRTWLNRCEKCHQLCKKDLVELHGVLVIPKRLVYVGSPGETDVKLIETEGQLVKYVALSYCWGNPQSGLLTTDDCIIHMMQGVRLNRLSKTIQDAIVFLRKLGLRYLWVDALCIIQGNEADWAEQAQNMGQIYSNAYLRSGLPQRGQLAKDFFLPECTTRSHFDFRLSKDSEVRGMVHYRESTEISQDYHEQAQRSPLLQRAWVKQEGILSCRTMDFSSKQIFWSCRTEVWAEDGQVDEQCQAPSADFINALWRLSISPCTDIHTEYFQRMFFLAWAEMVSDYSRLELTRERDRLPALTGMIDLASKVLPGLHVSGLWELNLADGLFWQPEQRPMARSKEHHAPSWSWASSTKPVCLAGHNPIESQVKLIDTSIYKNNLQVMRLRGRIQPCRISLDAEPPPPPSRSDRKLRDPPERVTSYSFTLQSAIGPRLSDLEAENSCRFDGLGGSETDFFFLGLSCYDVGQGNMWKGLLLRELYEDCGFTMYERVGIGWSRDSLGHNIKESMICLI